MEPLLIVLIVIIITIILIRIVYLKWKKSASRAMDDGVVMETAMGKIHYKLTGEGPVLFFMHGGPGGIDQGFFLNDLVEEGYSLLVVSRPGYLRTPFVPLSYEKQVDQYVELLDKLAIEKVVAMGYSAGGPLALNFANKYPNRTHALVMEAGVSTIYEISSEAPDSFWMKLFTSDKIQDFLSWITVIIVKMAFKMTFKSIITLETLLNKKEIKKFTNLVSNDKKRRSWVRKLLDTSFPMSIRKLGLNHDIELLTSIEKIPVDNINVKSLLVYSREDNDVKWLNAEYLETNLKNFELLTTHGGHFMWIGEDMEKIKSRRIEFLKSINYE
ncbi:alpha/beta hydrolase [Promethearchaeum syntrophicum]|uniref:Alpha/beta hydrolase n=1 Tax=Promethearchaeum syntrophicum TaxID=2594042 RepID=A0A5B9DGW0_9ARCH|nr:alpha/beta hydrolase [Candidatus Prometheoarchaeum syntrophicum]QEE17980.1 Proline iminopeptidase [Candidatus Prometheoarchaeum syntrophicum]